MDEQSPNERNTIELHNSPVGHVSRRAVRLLGLSLVRVRRISRSLLERSPKRDGLPGSHADVAELADEEHESE